MLRLQQLECHRIGTSLAVLESSCSLGKMVAVWGNPRFLKIYDHKPCPRECLPVVRQRTMKPDELGGEMRPGWINALPLLEVREAPAIAYLFAVVGYCGISLHKAGMGEHEHCYPVRFQDAVEGTHGAVQVRGIHQHIVCDHQVKGRISKGVQFGAGIHAEV